MDIIVRSPQESIDYQEEMESAVNDLYSDIDGIEEEKPTYSALAGEIMRVFQKNRTAKQNAGIEANIAEDLRAVSGVYDPIDLETILANGQSSIYMNLTSTKSRAAQSWIRDILLNPNNDAFAIEPSMAPALPQEIEDMITDHFEKEFEIVMQERGEEERKKKEQEAQAEQQAQGQAQGQEQPSPPPPKPMKVAEAQDMMLERNRTERDVREAILEEIRNVALFETQVLEKKIVKQLKEGDWDQALSDFIEDFCTFSVAVMKGPVITKQKNLEWSNGQPIVTEKHIFMNKRVSPYDIYPDPSSCSPQEGSFIEHIRLSETELVSLRGVDGYHKEAIDAVIDMGPSSFAMFDTGIEAEKADLERRGDTFYANEDVYHGLHFWSSVPARLLDEWDLWDKIKEPPQDGNTMYEIEAIMVGHEIIKCKLNDDPLNRRPYYKASYQNIPGSFYGRSLPSLMRPIQRICNACARALVTNMGYSSGPIITVNIDRLADDGDIDELRPLMTLQTTNDPSGNSGRPLEAFMIPSIANELLAVYDKFEIKADDATGIPRYAYGNERVGGAGQTASGLSMLMESATKSIKDAIRHISNGLIIPRVELEFYWLLIKENIKYTGDINVVAKGAEAITVKGSQEMKRNEFLQATANQIDQQLMGPEGRATLLREMAKDLNLPVSIVPSRLELTKKQKEAAKNQSQNQQMQQQLEQQKNQVGLQATQLQVEAQQNMHRDTMQIKAAEVQLKEQKQTTDAQIELQRMETQKEISSGKNLTSANKAIRDDQLKRELADQNAAMKLKEIESAQGSQERRPIEQ